jgi:NhaP-type Na+/H+ or K+/H+ antiporter
MFEQIEAKRWRPSRRVAVWWAVFSAFLLGALSGILGRQLITGPKIRDWLSVVLELALSLWVTLWLAISAARKDT